MGNDREGAMSLYWWNLQVSATLIVPLQICEVAVRNGVAEVLQEVHGENWPWSNGFIKSLSQSKRPLDYNTQRDLRSVASRLQTTGKVIAELRFAFWEKLFTRGQDARLWIPHLKAAFPGVNPDKTPQTARAEAFDALHSIRKLRNRIAHHEPIFTRDLIIEYTRIETVIRWRSPVAADWVAKVQGLTALIAALPHSVE